MRSPVPKRSACGQVTFSWVAWEVLVVGGSSPAHPPARHDRCSFRTTATMTEGCKKVAGTGVCKLQQQISEQLLRRSELDAFLLGRCKDLWTHRSTGCHVCKPMIPKLSCKNQTCLLQHFLFSSLCVSAAIVSVCMESSTAVCTGPYGRV